MSMRMTLLSATAIASLSLASLATDVQASETDGGSGQSLEELRALIEAQKEQLEKQRDALQAQERRLDALETQLDAASTTTRVEPVTGVTYGETPTVQPVLYRGVVGTGPNVTVTPAAQKQQQYSNAQTAQDEPVGEQPTQEQTSPRVPVVPEKGGVLTKQGSVVIEPSLEYEHSNVTRVSTGGVAILDTVLIGVFEATETNRDTATAAVTGRVGVTDRFEAEVKVPYVYRDDTITNTVISSGQNQSRRNVSGNGIGDVEFAGHYQLNDGLEGWPIFVGNLRVKTVTGTGPFDVDRTSAGEEDELPTGSGFWGVEPSITALFPSDPAVFYGNVGYLANISRDVDETVGGQRITDVDPGDAYRFSAGMGIALNDKASFSIGYQHDFIDETTSTVDGVETDSETLNVGALNFGVNYQLYDNTQLNLSVSAGVTEDAPDATVAVRMPIEFSDIF